jgi:DNA-binding SARP family transcriptional activator/tetratricopeptide (TPR) repeat protein
VGGADDQRIAVRLLGRVQVVDDGTEIDLGATGPRSLFAVLAMRANTTVTLDELVAAHWGELVPKYAAGGVYNYVSMLRKALEPGLSRQDERRLLTSSRAGYTLRLPPCAVDVNRFEDAAAEARRRWSADDVDGALARSDLALAQWSGPPLDGAVGPFADAERSRLELLKLDVQEIRCAALIEARSAGDAVATLSALAVGNPLRERLHELLMLALYRTGRQAEALEVYQRVRHQLVEELGIEPGPAMRRMHEHVLAGESVTAPGSWRAPARLVPAQVPHDVPNFTGRADELRRLAQLCADATDDNLGGSVVISAIDGAAGVGKTALAIRLANQMAASFPDGQLFLDLRGFDPRHPPLTPEDALEHLLRGLGADTEMLKADVVAQAALYRSLLAGRRVLVVLDNTVSAEQVRPLLPASKGCLALVTSRSRLSGLVARDGATRVSLDVLREAESLELLRRILGAAQVDADIGIARELTAHCGHLPLALRIAAERIGDSDHYELADMVAELRTEHDRLDVLSTVDDESSVVRAVFSWSYQALKPDDARAFRLLGLHPAVEVGLAEAAALLGTDVHATRRRLDGLVRWHLLEQVARDRYRFHDLLRIYAAECAERDECDTARRAAVGRMLAWYFSSAVTAREVLTPGFGEIDAGTADPEHPPVVLRNYDEAISWVGRELSTLADVLRLAVDHGFDRLAAKLATAMGVLYHSTSRWPDWLRVIEIGQAAARRVGDRLSQARLHNDSGVAYHALDRHGEAVACHEAAVDLLTDLGDQQDRTVAANLAVAYSMLGRHLEALPLLDDALAIARRQGNRFVEASVADGLGAVLANLGRYGEAIEHGQRCVDLFREVGAEHMLGHGLTQVGNSCLSAGCPDKAIGYFREALETWRKVGDRWGEVRGLHALARARCQAKRTEGVRELLTDALAIMRDMGCLATNEREAAEIRALLADLG